MNEEKSGMSRGLANGLFGAIIFMVIFICLIVFNGGSDPTGLGFGDDHEMHESNMIFNNQCNVTVNVTVYILSSNDWDKIYFTLDDDEQNAITITWEHTLVDVIVTYNLYGETKAIQYNINPNENQMVILI